MLLYEISTNTAEGIPYENFKDKISKVKEELSKGRHVEVIDDLKIIYSCEKWREKNEKNNL